MIIEFLLFAVIALSPTEVYFMRAGDSQGNSLEFKTQQECKDFAEHEVIELKRAMPVTATVSYVCVQVKTQSV